MDTVHVALKNQTGYQQHGQARGCRADFAEDKSGNGFT